MSIGNADILLDDAAAIIMKRSKRMSTVADVRKLLQDLIAPDLGAPKEGQAALKESLQALHAELKLVREEIGASEDVRAVERIAESTHDLERTRVGPGA